MSHLKLWVRIIREKRMKRSDRTQGTYGTPSIYALWESQKRQGKGERVYLKKKGQKCPRLEKGNRYTSSRNKKNYNWDKYKRAHAKTHYNQIVKSPNERILTAARVKWLITKRELLWDYQHISQQKSCKPEDVGWSIQWDERGKLPNKNPVSGKAVFQKWKGNWDFSRQMRAEEFHCHKSCPTGNAKRSVSSWSKKTLDSNMKTNKIIKLPLCER